MSVKHRIRVKGIEVTAMLTPRTAIKAFCMECVCWSRADVEGCTSPMCPLFPFRLGDAHSVSPERRSALAKRGQKQEIVPDTIPDYGL